MDFANRQLYLVPQFFENKPLDILIKEGTELNNLNDSVLGRALDSLYIKKPERIEALLFIMTLCLMIYASSEMKIRSSLKDEDEFFIDQKGKPTQTPTARWVFQTFIDIHVLTIKNSEQIVMNLKDYHHTLLRCLGRSYQINYLVL